MTRTAFASVIAGALLAMAFAAAAAAAEPVEPIAPAAPEASPWQMPPAPRPASAADATQFVQEIYDALTAGDARPFAAAIGPEALLDRMLAGLASPPDRWKDAAVERLGSGRAVLSGALAKAVNGAAARALPAQPGPAGMSWVSVRIYMAQMHTWHRVLVFRAGSSWRVADFQALDAGWELSGLALELLANPADEKPLPTAGFFGTLGLPLGVVILALAAGVLLGRFLARAKAVTGLDGRPRPATRSPLFWLAVVLCTLGGAIFFCVRLGHFISEQGTVDQIAQRAASHRMVQGSQVEDALRRWRENQLALTVKANMLATSDNVPPQAAEDFLKAFSQTEPPPPAAFFYLSVFEERQEQWAKAAEAWTRLSELLGGDGLALCSAAQNLARARDFRGAEELLRAAEKAGGLDARMLILRAAVRARQKKAAEAVADLRAVRASNQMPPILIYFRVQSDRMDFEVLGNDRAFVEFMTELKKELPRRPVMENSEGEE